MRLRSKAQELPGPCQSFAKCFTTMRTVKLILFVALVSCLDLPAFAQTAPTSSAPSAGAVQSAPEPVGPLPDPLGSSMGRTDSQQPTLQRPALPAPRNGAAKNIPEPVGPLPNPLGSSVGPTDPDQPGLQQQPLQQSTGQIPTQQQVDRQRAPAEPLDTPIGEPHPLGINDASPLSVELGTRRRLRPGERQGYAASKPSDSPMRRTF